MEWLFSLYSGDAAQPQTNSMYVRCMRVHIYPSRTEHVAAVKLLGHQTCNSYLVDIHHNGDPARVAIKAWRLSRHMIPDDMGIELPHKPMFSFYLNRYIFQTPSQKRIPLSRTP